MASFATLPPPERRLILDEVAARLGVVPVIVEKDFWVCWAVRVSGWGVTEGRDPGAQRVGHDRRRPARAGTPEELTCKIRTLYGAAASCVTLAIRSPRRGPTGCTRTCASSPGNRSYNAGNGCRTEGIEGIEAMSADDAS